MTHNMTALSLGAHTLSDAVSTLAELVSVYADGACHDDPARITQQLHGISALLSLTGAQLLAHGEVVEQFCADARALQSTAARQPRQ